MSDNLNPDNSQNNITETPEINNRFDVLQREIDQMENFVEANLIAHFPDPVLNNEELGLGLEPHQQQEEQQLDHQGNEMGGVAVPEPEPIVENPQTLEEAMDQLADISFDPVMIDQSAAAMMEFLKMVIKKKLHPLSNQGSNMSEDLEDLDSEDLESEEFQSSIAFYEPKNSRITPEQSDRNEVPLHTELSREVAIMNINRIGVVELLMQPSLLADEFPDMVASAKLIREVLPGTVDYNGTVHLMKVEYHMPSPLASTRECYSLRYSRKIRANMWAVVDQSVENLFGFDEITCRRNWSGCTILELPRAHTRVTWLENVEVNNSMNHSMLQPILGFQFGAKRWLSAFLRQSYWMSTPALRCDHIGKAAVPEGYKNLLVIAEKMMHKFFANASSSQNNNWVAIPGTEDIKVAIKPYPGNVEVAADGKCAVVIGTTAPIPVYQKELFQFLSDPRSRTKWDVIAMRYKVQERLRLNLGDGKNPEDFVCVFQFSKTEGGDPVINYLQRSYADSTMSFTVSTPVEVPTMRGLLNGTGDPKEVDILVSGFSVFPDSCSKNGEDNINEGSLLSAVFQFLDQVPGDGVLPPNSVATVRNIMEETMSLIKDAVVRGNRRTREGGSD